MYKHIIETIDEVIKQHQEKKDIGISERDHHYYIQGLEVAKQLIQQVQDTDIEMPHETLENVIIHLRNEISDDEMKDIIDNI